MATLGAALKAGLLEDDSQRALLSDVVLVSGPDGQRVPALRALLAVRSEFFKALLYSDDFREGRPLEVAVPHVEGETLKDVVEWCYTDDARPLRPPAEGSCPSADQLTRAVSLARAGDFLALPALTSRACDVAAWSVNRGPGNACRVVAALHSFSGSNQSQCLQDLYAHCMQVLEDFPTDELLQADASMALSAENLKEILSSSRIAASEAQLFQLLQQWAQHRKEMEEINANSPSGGGREVGGSKTFRDAAAIAEASLRPAYMPPSFLRDVVGPSGIFPQEKIIEAYQEQALLAQTYFEADLRLDFSMPRCPAWSSTGKRDFMCHSPSHTVETLNCPLLTPGGCYTWSMLVVQACDCFWVGVVSGRCSSSQWLGKQARGWAYGSNGSPCHATGRDNGPYTCIGPTFRCNDTVTLMLDLTGPGTLSVAVGKAAHFTVVFKDMLSPVHKVFLPAVSLKQPGAARMLKMSKVTAQTGSSQNSNNKE